MEDLFETMTQATKKRSGKFSVRSEYDSDGDSFFDLDHALAARTSKGPLGDTLDDSEDSWSGEDLPEDQVK